MASNPNAEGLVFAGQGGTGEAYKLPIESTGPLEVALNKRDTGNKIAAEQQATAAAQLKAQAERNKEIRDKLALDLGDVFQNDVPKLQEMYKEYMNYVSEGIRAGEDPTNPASKFYMTQEKMRKTLQDAAKVSSQHREFYQKLPTNGTLTPEYTQQVEDWARTSLLGPDGTLNRGLPPPVEEGFDYAKTLGAMLQTLVEEDVKAFAVPTEDGMIRTGKTAEKSRDKIMKAAKDFESMEAGFTLQNKREWESLSEPQRLQIEESARKNGFDNVWQQMLFEDMEGAIYKRSEANLREQSQYGAGFDRSVETADNFMKIINGLAEGDPEIYEESYDVSNTPGWGKVKTIQASSKLNGYKIGSYATTDSNNNPIVKDIVIEKIYHEPGSDDYYVVTNNGYSKIANPEYLYAGVARQVASNTKEIDIDALDESMRKRGISIDPTGKTSSLKFYRTLEEAKNAPATSTSGGGYKKLNQLK